MVVLFNQERLVAQAWPASENRIAVAELTYLLFPRRALKGLRAFMAPGSRALMSRARDA